MARQNLISGVIEPADQKQILEYLAFIRSKLDFGVTLSPSQIKSMSKAGELRTPFLEKAINTAINHPEILYRDFDDVEFTKSHVLMHTLDPISTAITEVFELVRINMMAVKSDTYSHCREVYKTGGDHAEYTPGLKATFAELAAYFKRGPRDSSPKPPKV